MTKLFPMLSAQGSGGCHLTKQLIFTKLNKLCNSQMLKYFKYLYVTVAKSCPKNSSANTIDLTQCCCCCRMHLGAITGQPGNGIIVCRV